MSRLAEHLRTLRLLEEGTDKAARAPFGQFCQCRSVGLPGKSAADRPLCQAERGILAGDGPAQVDGEADCPIERGRSLGWRIEVEPAGLLIDTAGQPSDLALLNALHSQVIGSTTTWPAHLLSDPAEIILRGELEMIEREAQP